MNAKNGWKTHEQVRRIKEQYPPGTRIRLGNMVEEEHAPPSGTEGAVQLVDDMGHLLMKWDNGQTLSLIPGEDSFSIIPRQEQGMTMQMGGLGQ